MKQYIITVAKEVVAEVVMNYEEFIAKYKCSLKLVEWLKTKMPNLKDCPYTVDFKGDKVIIRFYSVGNSVIQEIQ